ncbi:hypothetical protein ATY81_08140 [Rhizobium sp. R72]|uniref:hypothetical protein n=1 Tax=unclassified Rhizobium TaxID=2613769 RepID=UPI000B530A4F|nr:MULTISPECIES: hypothetical protein [unclassified Rhizobium]OWV97395.1 hypothetical protein ATY81_08140 [Rhizobium sp. R72]OWV97734.1 hypothetical protein ATY80_08140 [Rhizobium sp. R711]
MSLKIIATSLLAIGLASSALAQSNPAPAGSTMDKNHGNATSTTNGMKMKKIDKTTTGSTTHNLNKENCKSLKGKGSLQTQGGNSNTENTEDTCADNNN